MANDLTQLRATLSDAVRPATMSLTATVAKAMAEQQHEKQQEGKRTREFAIGGGVLALAAVAGIWFATTRRNEPPPEAPSATKVAAESPVSPVVQAQTTEPAAAAAIAESSNVPKTKAKIKTSAPPPAPARAKKSDEPVVRRQTLPAPPVVQRVIPSPQPAPPPAPTPAPPPAPPPSSVQPSAPPPAPPAPAPSAAGVRAVIQEYARAIEQRDIGAIRSVYPALSSSEQSIWQKFFQDARHINVAFQVSGIDVNGSSAQAHIAGTYDYQDTEGRTQPTLRVSLNANLRHDGSAWHIVSIR